MRALLLLACAATAVAQDAHITGVAHMAVYVHDVAKTRAFYHDFLGTRSRTISIIRMARCR